MDQPTEGAAHVASHRMPDSDRPRRPVPAWVTAPFADGPTGQEAPPAAAPPAAAPPAAVTPVAAPPATAVPVAEPTTPAAAPSPVDAVRDVPAPRPVLDPDAVVPDYPPSEDLLPPAPTSPALHTAPLDSARARALAPVPVSPVDAVREPALAGPAHQGPLVPQAGQPRFSVPGLEHVVVAGTTDEPVGPVGYRTPARFAHQQAAAASSGAPAGAFDALIAAPVADPGAVHDATRPNGSAAVGSEAESTATRSAGAESGLPSDAVSDRRRAVGATPSAVLGAVTGIGTTGLAAWWFTAPATVHAAGLLLGLVAIVCSTATLRGTTATWQRPVALLGAVLGVVGTLVLLWAVASALLPGAGLPDLTGTGTVPTIAP